MRTVHLGSATDWFRLIADQASPGAPDHVIAELQLEGLSASRRVAHHYSSGFADIASFFDELANGWRGWEGVREWESLEGDLKIQARHAYGHVLFRITVRHGGPGWGNDGWTATADLTIDPGEQLSNVASDIRSLAAGWFSTGARSAATC